MPAGSTDFSRSPGERPALVVLAQSDGCAHHPVIDRLTRPGVKGRDLADAVHALCAVHGRIADLFGEAAARSTPDTTAAWLGDAAQSFAVERAYLARMTAAVGPLPSTPGQAESDAAFAAQRHAFDMLARSDRTGCANGAALALAIDWQAFRRVLDAAAKRAGVAVVDPVMPDEVELATIAATAAGSSSVERARAFGAQQVFAQHRGLCDVIEARAIARDQL